MPTSKTKNKHNSSLTCIVTDYEEVVLFTNLLTFLNLFQFLMSIKKLKKPSIFSLNKNYVIRRAYPTVHNDVVGSYDVCFVSDRTMREILTDDMKQVERRYNRQLDNFAVDNEQLALRLKNKIQDNDKLNRQNTSQQVNE